MRKIALVFFIIFSVLAFSSISYCEAPSSEQKTQSLRGEIFGINWPASTVTIRWLQTEGYIVFDEISIFVPDSACILKAGQAIGFAQLQIGDQVTVEYINTSPGPLKLINMTVVSS